MATGDRVQAALLEASARGERIAAWVRFGFFALSVLLSFAWQSLGGNFREGGEWMSWMFRAVAALTLLALVVTYRVRYRYWFGWSMLAFDVLLYNAIGWASALALPEMWPIALSGAVPMIFGAVLCVAAAAVRQLRMGALVSGVSSLLGWVVVLAVIRARVDPASLGAWVNFASPAMWVARGAFFVCSAVLISIAGLNAMRMLRREIEAEVEFGRFVGDKVAQRALQHAMAAETRELTVLFTDLRNFTAFSEPLPPEAVLAMLSEHFAAIVPVVERHGGTVVKFIGDALMATFGAPAPLNDHALAAVRAGVDMLKAMNELNASFRARGLSELHMGVGIATGPAVVGELSKAGERTEYAVIGDTVNTASRLEGLNKEMHTRIVISAGTRDALKGALPTRPLGQMPVKGKAQPVEIFTVEGV